MRAVRLLKEMMMIFGPSRPRINTRDDVKLLRYTSERDEIPTSFRHRELQRLFPSARASSTKNLIDIIYIYIYIYLL